MARDGEITDPERQPGETLDRALRPLSFDDFTGQETAKANLKVFVQAARNRGDALDHVLLFGPPGLGKTTLAQIMAREMGVGFRSTSGPVTNCSRMSTSTSSRAPTSKTPGASRRRSDCCSSSATDP